MNPVITSWTQQKKIAKKNVLKKLNLQFGTLLGRKQWVGGAKLIQFRS